MVSTTWCRCSKGAALDRRLVDAAPDVLGGVARIKPGEEDGRAQRVRKARRMVVESLSWRQLVGSIQLQGKTTGDQGRHLRISTRPAPRLLGRAPRFGAARGEGEEKDED